MSGSPSIFSCPIPLPRSEQDDQPTIHPIPLILEDMDGKLHRTILVDINARGEFSITPWQQGEYRGIRVKGDIQCAPEGKRVVFVEWGKENGQGLVSVENPRRLELEVDLAKYLSIIDPETHTHESIARATRRFTSYLDGNEYTWRYHPPENLEMEWECRDSGNETIAYWSLKLPSEPEYLSSGCSLTIVHQEHEFLALELVATCWIVRTLQKRYDDAATAAHKICEAKEAEEVGADSESKAQARITWENRWADCEDSGESSLPSSENDREDHHQLENSTTSSVKETLRDAA